MAAIEARQDALEHQVDDNYSKNEVSHEWFYRLLKRLSNRDYAFLTAVVAALLGFIFFLGEAFTRIIEAISELTK